MACYCWRGGEEWAGGGEVPGYSGWVLCECPFWCLVHGSQGREVSCVERSANLWQAMDQDSTEDKIVINRIVSLKEDSGKN